MNFILTNYNGLTFRSLMEARWAIFFDYFQFRWDYEPHGFQLGDDKYLPDFYLKDFDLYVEVKYNNDQETLQRTRKFAIGCNIDIVVCDGNPHCNPLLLFAGSVNRLDLGFESKILWYYKPKEGIRYEATEESKNKEYIRATRRANNSKFGVLELRNILGKERGKCALDLKKKLLALKETHNVPHEVIKDIMESIKSFNQATCLRAFQEAYKSRFDGISLEQKEFVDNFNFNKGL